jgi:hypothetical protein
MSIYLTPAEAKQAYATGNIEAVVAAAAVQACEHRVESKEAFEAGKADALERHVNRNDFAYGTPLWVHYNRGYNLNFRSR